MTANSTRPFGVQQQIVVKTYDIDFIGIVSNIVYIRWLEDLRLRILDDFYPLQDQMKKGFGPVLAHTDIDYKKPIRLFHEVTGSMWMEKLTDRKWILSAEFHANGDLSTTAHQTGVFVDFSTGKPIPTPHELLHQYRQFFDDNQI